MTVHAVVFDLGNVLINWDPYPAIAGSVGPERARAFLSDADFDFAAWNLAQDAGRTWEEGEAAAVAAHPQWEHEIYAYRPNFAASLLGPVTDTVEILEDLKAAGTRLFALTNWSAQLFPIAREIYHFLDLFEDIVVSGDEKLAKPDPQIFAVLAARISHVTALENSVFIDDSARNVAAAKVAGMDAIRFVDNGHLRGDLQARGVPI
ncbi:MAG: HAD family phosphatase [Antricoccus sp.]